MESPTDKICIKRKGGIAGFSFLAGLLLAAVKWGKFSFLFALLILAVFPPVAFILKKQRKALVLCGFCVLAGILYNSVYTNFVYNKLTAFDGKEVTVKGYIKDWEYSGSDTCFLTVKGKINGINGTICFYADYGDFDYYDKITAKVRAEKIKDNLNFSAESYNRPKGIFLQGETATEYSVGKNINPLFREISHYRDYCTGQIKVKCGQKSADFLCAMLCGDKSELSRSDKNLSYRCGIGHLLAVSGAHLVILANLLSVLLSSVKNKKIRFGILMAVVWSFAVFSGFSSSVVRASLMITFLRSAFLFGRRADPLNSLGVSVIFLTAGCPYTAISPSFLLTVSASFVMEILVPKYTCGKGFFAKIKNTIITYLLIMFAMLPLNLLLFGGVSAIAPLTNLVVAPVCTVAMTFGFGFLLFGCVNFIAPVTIYIADFFMKFAVKLIEFFGEIPYVYIYGNFKLLNLLMIFACGYWLFYVLCNKGKSSVKTISLGFILIISLELIYSMLKITGVGNNKKELVVIPAGRGCEYVLKTDKSIVVFDYGAKGKGNSAVENYLEKQGTEKIDSAFLLDGEYDFTRYERDISADTKYIFLDSYAYKRENVMDFGEGSSFSQKDYGVSQGKKGYYLKCNDTEFFLSRKFFAVKGKKIKVTNNDGAMIYDFDLQKVRRAESGFD